MTEDIGTTKRKGLTPTQRLQLFERKKGICCICHEKIVGSFIDEHWRALGLGGSNDETNRDIAHPRCADIKTRDDMKRINKAKAQKRAAHGIKRSSPPIAARPKPERAAPRFDKTPLPPRNLYEKIK